MEKKIYTKKQIYESIKHWQNVLEGMSDGKFYLYICKPHVVDTNHSIIIFKTFKDMVDECSKRIAYLISEHGNSISQAKDFIVRAYNEKKSIYWTDYISDDSENYFMEISLDEKESILSKVNDIKNESREIEINQLKPGNIEILGYGNDKFFDLQYDILESHKLDKSEKIDITPEE